MDPDSTPAASASAEPSENEDVWDLQNLAQAKRLCDWMFEQYRGDVRGAVAEVGAGIGTFSERIIDAGAERLLAVEPEPAPSAALEQRLGSDPRVTIVRESLPHAPSLRAQSFDLVVCQNVLEHIEDDGAAVQAMAAALARGGRLVLLVPAHPRLYGRLDREFGHRRRYTRRRLAGVVEAADLTIVSLRSFNLLGIAGWVWKNSRDSGGIDATSLSAYEAMVRLWRPVEDRLPLPWGLSLVLRAEAAVRA